MSVSTARLLCACALIMVLSLSVRAESTSSSDAERITFDDAIAYALERNPDLLAFGYQLDVVSGRVQQASLAPNPELTIAFEDALGTDNFRGVDSAETTISLAWALERGVRVRRVDAARASASLSTVDAEILRVDVAAETARRFITLLANQARAITVSEAVGLAEETVLAVAHRVESGGAPQADLARAEAELATTRLLQEDMEHELITARHRLAAQWGETAPNFSQAKGDPSVLPNTEAYAALRERIEQNQDIARYLSTQRLAEAELRLAEAQRKPAWQARVGVRRMESSDDYALVAGITIPLAVRNRNQGRISEARAVISQTRAETAAARIRIETTLFVLYEALQHSLHRATTLQNEIIPRVELALAETRTAYERGRYSYLEWRTVQAELIDARRELIEASVDAHRQVIEIERLTGVRVAQPGTSR
jgi:cobalt-zinc-cadmium efflux system outer membrane protein